MRTRTRRDSPDRTRSCEPGILVLGPPNPSGNSFRGSRGPARGSRWRVSGIADRGPRARPAFPPPRPRGFPKILRTRTRVRDSRTWDRGSSPSHRGPFRGTPNWPRAPFLAPGIRAGPGPGGPFGEPRNGLGGRGGPFGEPRRGLGGRGFVGPGAGNPGGASAGPGAGIRGPGTRLGRPEGSGTLGRGPWRTIRGSGGWDLGEFFGDQGPWYNSRPQRLGLARKLYRVAPDLLVFSPVK